MNYAYRIIESPNGMVGLQGGTVPLLQVLNDIGQHGGELVSVVSIGPGVLLLFIKHANGPELGRESGCPICRETSNELLPKWGMTTSLVSLISSCIRIGDCASIETDINYLARQRGQTLGDNLQCKPQPVYVMCAS